MQPQADAGGFFASSFPQLRLPGISPLPTLNKEDEACSVARFDADSMRKEQTEKPDCGGHEGELRRALDEAGLRLTRQRAAVFDYLRSVDSHPTAEDVYASVRHSIPHISLATVYKALEALVESHLATKLAYADGPARYDCRCDAHYHIRCLKTGQVRDLETSFDSQLLDKLDPSLIDSLRQQGFEVTDYRLELLGHFSD